jgi:hypothetical protein
MHGSFCFIQYLHDDTKLKSLSGISGKAFLINYLTELFLFNKMIFVTDLSDAVDTSTK